MKTLFVWVSLAICQCANSFSAGRGLYAISSSCGHEGSDLSHNRRDFTARAAKLFDLPPVMPSRVGLSSVPHGSVIRNTWSRVMSFRARVTQWHEKVLEKMLGSVIGDEWSHWVVSRFGGSMLPVFSRAYISLIRR